MSENDPNRKPPQTAAPAEAEAPAQERRAGESFRRARDRRVSAVIEGMSDAFLALGPDWKVLYANREAARLNGTTPEALVGCDHWERWPSTRNSEVERQYRRAVAEQVPVQFEHFYPDVGVWHDVRAYPAEDGGLSIFYRDVTAQKQLEFERQRQARELADATDRAIAAEEQFRLLVDRVQEYAIFLLDPDGIITHWGRGAERIKGWKADEIVGRHLRDLYPADGSAEDGSAEDHLRHAALHGEYIGEGTRQRKNGEFFTARVVLTALRRGGRLAGFSKITQDLSGERERRRALEDAMRAAQSASTAKTQFLANTSHEIRTPLNAIIGYAELLVMGLAGALTEQQRQYLSRVQATSKHLLGLVNDVLDLSKIEAGEMRAAREPGLVHESVAAALALVEPQARARELSLSSACPHDADGAAYLGDAERVRQILANLLSNAVRFTEPGGRVTVTCGSVERAPREAAVDRDAHGGPWTYVRVEDTGVGIAPDQVDRIWDAFVQADTGHTRRFGGSGLGLAISRQLARLMGGDITVRSQPGLGSAFVVWLPGADPREAVARRAAAPPPAPALPPAKEPTRAMAELGRDEGAAFNEIADALATEIERVMAMYVARLRADPETPSAHGLHDAQIQDHGVTFVADLASCLRVIGQDGEAAEMMLRDGSAIQRLIAHRHGAQRAMLGWAEEEMRREYVILREEIRIAVERRVTRTSSLSEVERALAVLAHFLAQAEEESVAAFRKGARSGEQG
ncbi:MAG: PAS domain-containing sensor histidine kinase [Gemmatimonadaceae bacterium]